MADRCHGTIDVRKRSQMEPSDGAGQSDVTQMALRAAMRRRGVGIFGPIRSQEAHAFL